MVEGPPPRSGDVPGRGEPTLRSEFGDPTRPKASFFILRTMHEHQHALGQLREEASRAEVEQEIAMLQALVHMVEPEVLEQVVLSGAEWEAHERALRMALYTAAEREALEADHMERFGYEMSGEPPAYDIQKIAAISQAIRVAYLTQQSLRR